MKKIVSFIVGVVLVLSIIIGKDSVRAQESEVRAAWVSTVFNIDWPSKSSYRNPQKQKQEYIYLLNKLQGVGINTVMVQVRPESDAFYKSSISPWSRFLTGNQGENPGYDPLQFLLDESHKRGIKVHAWFNPYRASIYNDISSTAKSNPLNTHRDWVINYQGKWYYDPGNPQVTKYISDVVAEVVENYQIDGVHFDDYFYPGPGFPDSDTFSKYGNGNIDNWRRSNINNMVKTVRDRIKSIKPSVEFGISPAGIWRNSSNDKNGSRTNGGESYNKQYADTRYWIKNGLVDYVVPQVYWKIGHPRADYATLVRWWSDQVRGTGVDLYIGQGIYKHGQSEYNGENVAEEIKNQLDLNRHYKEIKGSVFFSARDIVNIDQVASDLKSIYKADNHNQGVESNRRNPYQNKLWGRDRAETAIKISQQGWKNGSSSVILVNGKDLLSGLVSSPLAASYDAPILLSYPGKLSDNTINEIKRLGAKNIILVGRDSSAINSDIASIKGKLFNISISKINDSKIELVSRKIADKLSEERQVDTVYIASKEALVDVLSIASKAGKNRSPILVSSKEFIHQDLLNWMKNKRIKNVYFIGGPNSLSDNVIRSVEEALGISLANNRIYGNDRIETNTRVVEKFYPNSFSPKVFVARSDAPIDAITVSSFAQKTDSPILLAGSSLTSYQKNVLAHRSTSLLYQIGGGININSYKNIYSLLEGVIK
nr:family 10 glycosylhydrolase [uncultured Peptostreptococcus sp.]